MELLLIILSIIIALVALVGSVVPILPGLPLSFLSILLAKWSGYCDFSTLSLILWAVVITVVTLLDNFIPPLLTKFGGGSKLGARGSFIGSLVGIFFPPLGIIFGALVGAFVAELLLSKSSMRIATISALTSFLGFMISTVIKVFISLFLLYKVVIQLIF